MLVELSALLYQHFETLVTLSVRNVDIKLNNFKVFNKTANTGVSDKHSDLTMENQLESEYLHELFLTLRSLVWILPLSKVENKADDNHRVVNNTQNVLSCVSLTEAVEVLLQFTNYLNQKEVYLDKSLLTNIFAELYLRVFHLSSVTIEQNKHCSDLRVPVIIGYESVNMLLSLLKKGIQQHPHPALLRLIENTWENIAAGLIQSDLMSKDLSLRSGSSATVDETVAGSYYQSRNNVTVEDLKRSLFNSLVDSIYVNFSVNTDSNDRVSRVKQNTHELLSQVSLGE